MRPRSRTRIPASGRASSVSSVSSLSAGSSVTARSLEAAADEVPRHDDALDLTRAFPDAPDAQLAVPPLERQILGHARPAVDLHRPVDDPAAGLRRDKLGHGGLRAELLAAVGLGGGGQRQPAGLADVDLVVDD